MRDLERAQEEAKSQLTEQQRKVEDKGRELQLLEEDLVAQKWRLVSGGRVRV